MARPCSRLIRSELSTTIAAPATATTKTIRRAFRRTNHTFEPKAAEDNSAQKSATQSTTSNIESTQTSNDSHSQSATVDRKLTAAERDEQVKAAMEGLAGDGGQAGLELEDGQPVTLKKHVKANMFRYI